MRIKLSELSFMFAPPGKVIWAIRIEDGDILCELRDKPDARHAYRPHPRYPWFCTCGYPEHETLVHLPSAPTK